MHLRLFVITVIATTSIHGGHAVNIHQINKWAEQLRNGVSPEFELVNNNIPDDLSDVISKAYVSAETSVKILLKFAKYFREAYLEVSGYEAIYEAMTKAGDPYASEIFILASSMKDTVRHRFNKLDKAGRRRLAALKLKLPAVVQEIVFGSGTCNIKNKKFGTYLHAADGDFKFDDETRRVFAWMNPGSKGTSSQEWWNLTSTGDGEFWGFESPHYGGERLHAFLGLEGQADEDRRRTGTTLQFKTGGLWKLKPVNAGKDVGILNAATSECLYATMSDLGFDDERRSVYTWIPKPHDTSTDASRQWEIHCPGK